MSIRPSGGASTGGTGTSSQVSYDPTASGLSATDVQAALDEITARVVALEAP